MAGQVEPAKTRKKGSNSKRKAFTEIENRRKEHGKFKLERGGHGYGIQPIGNLYMSASGINLRDVGLGALSCLPDSTLLDVFALLSANDLCRLALVSKGMYVFAHGQELWRTLTLQRAGGLFEYTQCWKQTYMKAALKAQTIVHKPLKVKGFYSDLLFQSWLCASLEIKPQWTSRDNIPRRANLTPDEFVRDFEEPNRPVIISDAMATWPAFLNWERDYLLSHAGDVPFAAGPVEMPLRSYFNYADRVEEERPLYVFDPKFAEKVPQLAMDYHVPPYFSEDLFSLLGDKRPDYRWLIMGPARSGSSWHIDPNSTSAWNAVIRGSKKWILFPPGEVPPGVFPSPDGADVATSVSLTEWLMNFYERSQRGEQPRPTEGVCRAGEILFVPRGWWHMVLNLEESIAITQNYVSRRNLLPVLEFLQRPNARALVSGTRDRESLHDLFRSRFEEEFPHELEKIQKAEEEKREKKQRTSFWEGAADTHTGGFRFGF